MGSYLNVGVQYLWTIVDQLQQLSEATDGALWERFDSVIASALIARSNDVRSKFAGIHQCLDRSV